MVRPGLVRQGKELKGGYYGKATKDFISRPGL
jgi:hypothetical protein